MKILELLDNGEKLAVVARRFVVNKSTIRTIRKNKNKIPGSASKLGPHAKFLKISISGMFFDLILLLFHVVFSHSFINNTFR